MEALLRDLKYGIRMLLRSPGVTAVAVLALALGIGVNTAIFSVVYAVLLRPLPVRDVDGLVTVAMVSRKLNVSDAQPEFTAYARLKESGRWFKSIAAASPGTAALTIGETEEAVKFWRVTQSFLPALGVAPAVGRNFLPEEDQPGAARVAMLSHGFWQGRLNGDPRALGSTLTVDGQPYSVVGVLPPGFHVDGRPADIYAPVSRSLNSQEALPVNIYARLRPGVTAKQAQAEIDAHTKRQIPSPLGWEPRLWSLRDFEVREVRLSLWLLLGAVGLVLLLACANTATLLLARASTRRKEIALRTALGAGRTRLVRQVLTESTILALLGGACGVLVAMVCVEFVPLLAHERLPGLLEQTRVDGVVLAFTLGLSVLTGLVFGTAPALTAPRMDVYDTLKEGGRSGAGDGRRSGWNILIVTETALALVLAISASLLIRTFFYLRDVAPGFRVDSLLTARITPPPKKFTSREQALAYWEEMIARVREIPGVKAATFAQSLPLTGDHNVANWPVEGYHAARPEDAPTQWTRVVEQEYFRTMQIPLLRGRLFTERDDMSAPKVVIVNETFARRYWPDQDPIGKHIGGGEVPVFEVVGVVGDVRLEESTKAAPTEVLFHSLQGPTGRIALAVRADSSVYRSPLLLEPAVRRAVMSVDSTQPVTQFAEMRQLISDRIAPKRLSAQLIGAFATLALVLAAVGIYGVLSFSVAQRTHEIGVRVALGARRGQVLGMVVGEAALLAVVGIGLGIAAALGLTQVMKNLLFGVSETDPWIFAGSAAALLAIAVVASFVPAHRAARVDPLVALRQE
jgi:putative ABC transport system permease protein